MNPVLVAAAAAAVAASRQQRRPSTPEPVPPVNWKQVVRDTAVLLAAIAAITAVVLLMVGW